MIRDATTLIPKHSFAGMAMIQPIVSRRNSINYYESVEAAMGKG